MDDEDMILDVAGKILMRLGFEVVCAKNGEQAIIRYREAHATGKRFDVVIMDLAISNGMGGRETVKLLRELDPSVKAILSSGSFDDPAVSDYAEYGFIGVVSKPYSIKTLGDTVLNVIRGADSVL
jgi:CheY-like chemotaxis protein